MGSSSAPGPPMRPAAAPVPPPDPHPPSAPVTPAAAAPSVALRAPTRRTFFCSYIANNSRIWFYDNRDNG